MWRLNKNIHKHKVETWPNFNTFLNKRMTMDLSMFGGWFERLLFNPELLSDANQAFFETELLYWNMKMNTADFEVELYPAIQEVFDKVCVKLQYPFVPYVNTTYRPFNSDVFIDGKGGQFCNYLHGHRWFPPAEPLLRELADLLAKRLPDEKAKSFRVKRRMLRGYPAWVLELPPRLLFEPEQGLIEYRMLVTADHPTLSRQERLHHLLFELDFRLLKLFNLLLAFLRMNNLSNAHTECFSDDPTKISLYAVLLLVTHFFIAQLKSLPPARLLLDAANRPTEAQLQKIVSNMIQSPPHAFIDEVNRLRGIPRPKTVPPLIAQLFKQMIHYYGVTFDFGRHAVDIREVKPADKLMTKAKQQGSMQILEPIEGKLVFNGNAAFVADFRRRLRAFLTDHCRMKLPAENDNGMSADDAKTDSIETALNQLTLENGTQTTEKAKKKKKKQNKTNKQTADNSVKLITWSGLTVTYDQLRFQRYNEDVFCRALYDAVKSDNLTQVMSIVSTGSRRLAALNSIRDYLAKKVWVNPSDAVRPFRWVDIGPRAWLPTTGGPVNGGLTLTLVAEDQLRSFDDWSEIGYKPLDDTEYKWLLARQVKTLKSLTDRLAALAIGGRDSFEISPTQLHCAVESNRGEDILSSLVLVFLRLANTDTLYEAVPAAICELDPLELGLFHYRTSLCSVSLFVGQAFAIRQTAVLRCLSLLEPRFEQVCTVMLYFAREKVLDLSSCLSGKCSDHVTSHHYLSSYAISLMVLYYFQRQSLLPPVSRLLSVLDTFSKTKTAKRIAKYLNNPTEENNVIGDCEAHNNWPDGESLLPNIWGVCKEDINTIRGKLSLNNNNKRSTDNLSAVKLLLGVLHFYGVEFDPVTEAIVTRTGKAYTRKQLLADKNSEWSKQANGELKDSIRPGVAFEETKHMWTHIFGAEAALVIEDPVLAGGGNVAMVDVEFVQIMRRVFRSLHDCITRADGFHPVNIEINHMKCKH